MWDDEGRPYGVLIQDIPPGCKNDEWCLEVDIEAREKKERDEIDHLDQEVKGYRRLRRERAARIDGARIDEQQSLGTMASTVFDQPSALTCTSSLDTHSLSANSSSVWTAMTSLSGEANQQMLTYLALGQHDFVPSVTKEELQNLPMLREPISSNTEARMRCVQMSLAERALKSMNKAVAPKSMSRPFSASTPRKPPVDTTGKKKRPQWAPSQ